jgi:hypothetical protein
MLREYSNGCSGTPKLDDSSKKIIILFHSSSVEMITTVIWLKMKKVEQVNVDEKIC